jgi:hypothetical protein
VGFKVSGELVWIVKLQVCNGFGGQVGDCHVEKFGQQELKDGFHFMILPVLKQRWNAIAAAQKRCWLGQGREYFMRRRHDAGT